MVQTFFEIKGKKYKLKYQKINTAGGELYQGILFFKTVIGFSFLKTNEKSILFDNDFLDNYQRNLIVEVIEENEKKSKMGE